jgi:uncharacterized membrane protein YcaP (DUF421 family)
MLPGHPVDWQALLVPSESLLELVLRGSVVYLGILVAFRVFRRESGAMSSADLLMLVLIADAAQNAMASDYHSITEGAVLVGTIIGWNYALDWLAYRSPFVRRLLSASPSALVVDGRLHHANMRRELMSRSELAAQLREHGIEHLHEVKRAYLEGDGKLSVIRSSPESDDDPAPRQTPGAG